MMEVAGQGCGRSERRRGGSQNYCACWTAVFLLGPAGCCSRRGTRSRREEQKTIRQTPTTDVFKAYLSGSNVEYG